LEEIERLELAEKMAKDNRKRNRSTNPTFNWSDESDESDDDESQPIQQNPKYPELFGLSYQDSVKILIEKIVADSKAIGEGVSVDEIKAFNTMTVLQLKIYGNKYHDSRKIIEENAAKAAKAPKAKYSYLRPTRLNAKETLLTKINAYCNKIGKPMEKNALEAMRNLSFYQIRKQYEKLSSNDAETKAAVEREVELKHEKEAHEAKMKNNQLKQKVIHEIIELNTDLGHSLGEENVQLLHQKEELRELQCIRNRLAVEQFK